jgi:tRNA pseudouridine55 synthase
LEFHFLEGEVLLFDKPAGWTSFDLVNKVRKLISRHLNVRRIKVGHAGTLDPMATGLMILCTGKATKEISRFQGMDKSYIAEMEFGKTTPSFDAETEIDHQYPFLHIDRKNLLKTLSRFTGTFDQLPPAYSAKKVGGQRAYKLARKGKEVKLQPHEVTINKIELIKFDLPYCTIAVDCSKGTYIRALARDIGFFLDSGAYLTALVRTRIGPYDLSNAMDISEFEKIINEM